ncbi:protein prenyltransferase alpha subunit repeat containing protein 1, partial [Paragonimus westermani]
FWLSVSPYSFLKHPDVGFMTMESVSSQQSIVDPLLSDECNMFLLEFSILLDDCAEYDLLPHVESGSHRSLVKCESSLGICTCTIDWCYRNLTRLHPNSYTDASLTYLLLINPNTTTFWNYRRRAIQSNGASIHRELWLTKLILQTHPRSNETIFHRRWIVQHHLAQDMCALMSELDLCDQIAGRYRMHYGLWEYRRFILHHLGSQACATELERVDKWLQYHPTDTSGWSYLTHLFQLMITDTVMFSSPDMQQLVVQRLKQTSDTLQLYPERECLWIFRRNLLLFLHKLADKCDATNLDWHSVEPLFSRVRQVVSLALTDCIRFQSVGAFIDWYHSHALLSFSDRPTWHQMLWSRQLLWLTQNLTESRSPS